MDSLKRDVIRTEIDRQRAKRVQLTASLPAINRDSLSCQCRLNYGQITQNRAEKHGYSESKVLKKFQFSFSFLLKGS
jgi:hypothetical protein